MVIIGLFLLGLALGSFVNALVWRLHEQSLELAKKKPSNTKLKRLSVVKGRSMCPDCGHTLKAKDLIPLFSWLSTQGKCRYCKSPISYQYPVVELATAVLFIASYVWWPEQFSTAQVIIFCLWLGLLVGLMALLVYDYRWYLLPNRILAWLVPLALVLAVTSAFDASDPLRSLINTVLAVVLGGGLFYVLYQVSNGKWIGGGDVKLGWLLGLIVGTPARSFLVIFLAATLGSLASLPLILSKKMNRNSTIPFGPFLIAGAIVVVLFGHAILHWYQRTFMAYTI
jgi:prepilin signal peptidase PulO-like enzyme (type II secretory pathway)